MSLAHSTLTLTRNVAATPARVFAMWKEPEERVVWGAPFEGVTMTYTATDFSEGGHEVCECKMPDGETFTVKTNYYNLVPDQRLVFTEALHAEGANLGVSLVSVDIAPAGEGVTLTVHIQSVALDGSGFEHEVEGGWSNALDAFVARATAVPA
ncbi:MAG: SRPBCC domain-containing protein [Pseudomonadota bacterium]